MYVRNVVVTQGAKILWEGIVKEISFGMTYLLGIDDDWNEAERRGTEITEQMVLDWLEEMSGKGRIERIDPFTFLCTFENGASNELVHKYLKLFMEKDFIKCEGAEELSKRTSKKIQEPPEDCMQSQAVKLIFDATGSQDRMNRIMRGFEEPYSFVHQENGDWSCLNREGKAYRLFVNLENSTGCCTCQDFIQRGAKLKMPCKHIYGFVVQTQKIDWNKKKQEAEL